MIGMSRDKFVILRKKYAELCCKPRYSEIKKTSDQITELEDRLGKYQRAIIEHIREINFKQEMIEALKIIPDLHSKEIEFDKLVEHPDIENISIDGESVVVFTKHIDIEYKNKVYSIGKFIIQLSTDARAGWVVMFKNLSNTIENCPHPHINSHGMPCLGNIQECLPHMIGAHQYAAAISVCIQYLKSYSNDNDGKPYHNIEYWPIKT